jgi:hypothetical protein
MRRYTQGSNEGRPRRPTEAVDIAARYLVYKVFDAISGTPETWRPLLELEEKTETLARAVERGWVVVLDHRREGQPTVRVVALTDDGRRMARRNLH